MLIIVLVVTVTLLYFLGIIIGSSIEKQRWEEKAKSQPVHQKLAMPPAGIPERHTYAEHQRMLNDRGEVVWEQKTYSKKSTPRGKNIDLLA